MVIVADISICIMDDFLICPMCENKLRNKNLNNFKLFANEIPGSYVERTCAIDANHVLQIFTDKLTSKVCLCKISLNSQFSKFINIDYIHNECKISCFKMGKAECIDILKIIEPDFPKLENLIKEVDLYIMLL